MNECRSIAKMSEDPWKDAFDELADYNIRLIHTYRSWLTQDKVIITPGLKPVPEDDTVYEI